jgi:hypothetical protein
MAQEWQKIDGAGQICHWWQDQEQRRISAMDTTTALILLMVIGASTFLLSALATVVRSDGRLTAFGRLYHRPAARAPRSHHQPF